MGVKLTSTDGILTGIEGRVTVVGPETGCLQCRGRINPRALQAEVLEVSERADRVAEGYAVGLAERDPAVIAFTTGVAAQAVSEFLARIFSLDDEPPSTELLMRFHRREIRRNTRTGQSGHWCTDQANFGAGDSAPFLGTINRIIDWWRRHNRGSSKINKVRIYESAASLPEQLPRRVVAVAGDPAAWAVMECPCGTGHRLTIRIRPHGQATVWKFTQTERRPSLYPSVDYDSPGRRCHFWLRDGRVTWVP
jgi:hypothetical protein